MTATTTPHAPESRAATTARRGTTLPLVAALALVTLELVRSSGPSLDVAFSAGVTAAVAAAVTTYALPGVIAVVLVAVTPRLVAAGRRSTARLLAAAVVGALLLAALRLVLPLLTAGVRFGVGLGTVALAIAVLTLAVAASTARHGSLATVRALVLGLVTNVGLQLALGTWDAVWRTDLAGWAVAVVLTVVVVAAVVLTAVRARPAADGVQDEVTGEGRPRLWALGPFLALAAMVLANPAFVASQAGVSLVLAGVVVAVGLLLGVGLVAGSPGRPGRGQAPRGGLDGVVAIVLLGVATAGTLVSTGPLVLVSFVLLAAVAPPALAVALTGGRAGGQQPWRAAASATLVGLGTILPLLIFQLDYDVPLGFPNALVVVAAAAVLGVATLGVGRPARAPAARDLRGLAAVAVAAVVLGTAVTTVGSVAAHRASADGASAAGADGADGSGPSAAQDEVTVVVWNLHYGVTPAGHVRLEEVARAIERTGACVVLLQEVSRGWVMGGGADMGTWLANRLGMRMSFAPAADRQFGNAILSCVPHDDVVVHPLPYGDGPQRRSAISATVALPEPQRYTSVHLQHRQRNTPTRLAQLDALLDAGDLGVLGGDFNSEPGWPEIDLVLDSGFTSAQDEVGDAALLTSPTTDLRHRIDWVFVPDDVEATALEHLREDLWSDHIGLVLTHRTGG